MNIRNILMLVLALSSAGATGYAVLDFMEQQRFKSEANLSSGSVVEIQEKASLVALIASSDLRPGQFVRPEDLEWQPWPETANHERFVTLSDEDAQNDALADEARDSFKGGVMRNPMLKGQPIQKGQVVFPGDRGFLAAVLKPGMQAVSVSIAKEAGVSGLVFPGDRVDVVVALRLKGHDVLGDATTRFVSTTMLEDVRVLAIDQTLSVDDGEDSIPGKTATLEVSSKQARKVSVAREMGKISLALRSLAIEDSQLALFETEDLDPIQPSKASFVERIEEKKSTKIRKIERDFTLDTEIFTINGQDMSLLTGRSESSGVVVLRGNLTEEPK